MHLNSLFSQQAQNLSKDEASLTPFDISGVCVNDDHLFEQINETFTLSPKIIDERIPAVNVVNSLVALIHKQAPHRIEETKAMVRLVDIVMIHPSFKLALSNLDNCDALRNNLNTAIKMFHKSFILLEPAEKEMAIKIVSTFESLVSEEMPIELGVSSVSLVFGRG